MKKSMSLDKRDEGERVGSSRQGLSPLFTVPNSVNRSSPDVPKLFEFKKKALIKQQLIKQLMDEYAKPTVGGKITFTPSTTDMEDYAKHLKRLSIKDLELVGSFKEYKLKLDLLDRLKSIDKKKHAVVTIFNDNKTTDTGVIQCYSRTFSRNKMRYIVMNERGHYDPEFKMMHFYYFANHPFPILFVKGMLPEDTPDSKLLDATIEMQVLEALANINISKTINIILVFIIFVLIINILNLLLTAKASGII